MTSEFAIAVHAVVCLNHRKQVTSSEVLAKNICTSPTRVRRVLARLKKAGLVETKEGIEGGYHFTEDPGRVNLRMLADALEVSFVSSSWKSGSQDMDCMIASGMGSLLDELYSMLDENCRQQLEQITIADLEDRIFCRNTQYN